MRLGIRAKLFLVSLGLLTLSAAAAHLYLSTLLHRLLVDRVRSDLVVRARLLSYFIEAHPRDPAGWDPLADALGRATGERVTLIAVDGRVLGDSELSGPALLQVENHGDRPEVREALEGGSGSSTRHSTTLRQRMMYVALPFPERGAPEGVVRIAMPLSEVDAALSRLRALLHVGLLLLLGLAAALSSAGAHVLLRRLRQMTQVAERMAEGDLHVRTRSPKAGGDEVSMLGQTLDHLAESLSTTVGELRAERDLLSGILQGMQEGVLLVSRGGRIALLNPALRQMLLLSADAAGQPAEEVLRDEELRRLLERAWAERGASAEIELFGLHPRRLLVYAVPLLGGPERMLMVFVDVTELRRLESLRRDFVANVSHELRTPVTAIRSAAETLLHGASADKEAGPRFVDIIERNAERLQRLVEDLLDLSRIESRAYQFQIERLDLRQLVPRTLSLLRDRADRKGIALVAQVPADLLLLPGDRRALEQVLTNLVDNAIKYCPEGAQVSARVAVGPGEWSLLVADTGPGIAAVHLPRLFERFYRVDAGRSRQLGGTGLGLSIVKHLVEGLGGTVSVESAPGRGSTFLCRFRGSPQVAETPRPGVPEGDKRT